MDKFKVLIGAIVAAAVLVTAAMWILLSGKESLADLLIPTIAVLLAVISMKFVWDRAKSIKAGLPAEDELSKRAAQKAGYYAFIAGIWTAVGTMFASAFVEREYGIVLQAHHYTAPVVLVPGIVFVLLALYFRDRGRVE